MKTILIVTLFLWLYGSFELIKLLNNFNALVAHGELVDTSNRLTPKNIMELQHNAH